jgi:hypothetical protein
MSAHLILFALAALALWLGWLYLAPFGRCPKCQGTGRIKSGKRRVKVCPAARGAAASSDAAPAPSTGSPSRSATAATPPPDTSKRTTHEGNLADN